MIYIIFLLGSIATIITIWQTQKEADYWRDEYIKEKDYVKKLEVRLFHILGDGMTEAE